MKTSKTLNKMMPSGSRRLCRHCRGIISADEQGIIIKKAYGQRRWYSHFYCELRAIGERWSLGKTAAWEALSNDRFYQIWLKGSLCFKSLPTLTRFSHYTLYCLINGIRS